MLTRKQRQERDARKSTLIDHTRSGLAAEFVIQSEFNAHHAKTLKLISELQPGDFPERRIGRLQLAAQFGLLDARLIPVAMVKANGNLNLELIEDRPARREKARRDDPEGYGHSFPEIPEYDAIPAAVIALCGLSNYERRQLGRPLGLTFEDGSAGRLSDRIRGVLRALWLFHLLNNDAVEGLRFRRLPRKAGDAFVAQPLWYHPSDVARYRGVAWVMHADGGCHADTVAYLRALCMEWSACRDGREHVGAHTLAAVESILDVLAEAA